MVESGFGLRGNFSKKFGEKQRVRVRDGLWSQYLLVVVSSY